MAEGTGNEKSVAWTVYSGSQNLPAILNDPKRGKQVRDKEPSVEKMLYSDIRDTEIFVVLKGILK
jgi:hypothetical protein